MIQLGGASWIPWVWLAADRALESRAAAHAVLCGAGIALQLFAGSPDMSLLTVAGVAAWMLWPLRPRRRGAPFQLGGLPTAVTAGAFALALGAALWLPALDLTRNSARWSLESAHRAVWSVHPFGLAEIFSPVPLTDLPIGAALRGWLYDGGVPLVHAVYLGAPMLALVAAALGGPALRARAVALAVLAPSLIFALGRHTPVYEVAVALVPPLRVLRYPSKAMVLVALAWALLAGVGFDRWKTSETLSRKRWVSTVVGPLLSLTVAGAVIAALLRWRPGAFGPLLLPEQLLSSTWAEALAPASVRIAGTVVMAAAVVAAALLRPRQGPGRGAARRTGGGPGHRRSRRGRYPREPDRPSRVLQLPAADPRRRPSGRSLAAVRLPLPLPGRPVTLARRIPTGSRGTRRGCRSMRAVRWPRGSTSRRPSAGAGACSEVTSPTSSDSIPPTSPRSSAGWSSPKGRPPTPASCASGP